MLVIDELADSLALREIVTLSDGETEEFPDELGVALPLGEREAERVADPVTVSLEL